MRRCLLLLRKAAIQVVRLRGRVTENQGAETRIETKMPRIDH